MGDVPPTAYSGYDMGTPNSFLLGELLLATTRRTFAAPELQPLLEYLRTQCPDRRLTLAEAEEAVMSLFRQLGPALLESLLQSASSPDAEKKGHHRCVRVTE